MKYFPMFMNIENRRVIICGGGKHAAEKLKRLEPFKPELSVISENISDELKNAEGISVQRRRFSEEDLRLRPVFVIAAEEESENERIAEICSRHGVPVNAVDQIKDCDFIFPSMIVTERLCVGVSTGGISPTGAVCLRDIFSDIVPDGIDGILLWANDLKKRLNAEKMQKCLLKKILRAAVYKALEEGRALTEEELETVIRGI